MSSALAIAGVTAVLRDLLNDGLINHNVSGTLGSGVSVTLLPPDRVVPTGGNESSQINLFLYLVTPNAGWRNEALPSRDASGRLRLSNPPLALDLHYLLSVYTSGDLHAEILLGYAMQLLHEMPVLTRDSIRTALDPSPDVGVVLPQPLRALADCGLQDQIELIKLTPQYLSTEEMSKLWTAMQSHFRPTAAYTASVVLIEARQPARTPLPVLSRGPVDALTGRDRGVEVLVGLLPALPTLTAAVPPAHQPAATIDDIVVLTGHHLEGSGHTVLLINDRLGIEAELPALPPASPAVATATRVEFSLEGQSATLPAGIYRVALRLLRPGETTPRTTNRVALAIAPRMNNLPLAVPRGGDGSASFTIDFDPLLRHGQDAVLLLGVEEFRAQATGSPASELAFTIADAPVGSHLARLRVDGIESAVIDRSAEPPAVPRYIDSRRVVIT